MLCFLSAASVPTVKESSMGSSCIHSRRDYEDLQQAYDDLTGQIDYAQLELQTLQQENCEANIKNLESKKKLAEQSLKEIILRNQILDLERELSESQTKKEECEGLQHTCENLAEQLEQSESQLSQLQQQHGNNSRELQEKGEREQELLKQISELQQKLTKPNDAQKARARLMQTCEDLHDKLLREQSNLLGIQKENSVLERTIKEQEEKNKVEQEKRDKNKQELTEQILALKKELERAQSTTDESSSIKKQYKKEKTKWDRQRKTYEEQMREWEDQRKAHEKEMVELQKQIESLKERSEQSKRAQNTLIKELKEKNVQLGFEVAKAEVEKKGKGKKKKTGGSDTESVAPSESSSIGPSSVSSSSSFAPHSKKGKSGKPKPKGKQTAKQKDQDFDSDTERALATLKEKSQIQCTDKETVSKCIRSRLIGAVNSTEAMPSLFSEDIFINAMSIVDAQLFQDMLSIFYHKLHFFKQKFKAKNLMTKINPKFWEDVQTRMNKRELLEPCANIILASLGLICDCVGYSQLTNDTLDTIFDMTNIAEETSALASRFSNSQQPLLTTLEKIPGSDEAALQAMCMKIAEPIQGMPLDENMNLKRRLRRCFHSLFETNEHWLFRTGSVQLTCLAISPLRLEEWLELHVRVTRSFTQYMGKQPL